MFYKCFIIAFPKGFKVTSLELSRVGQLKEFSILKAAFGYATKDMFVEFKRLLSILRKEGILLDKSTGFKIMVEYCRKNGYLISEHEVGGFCRDSVLINITSTKSEKNRLKKIVKTLN